MTSGFGQKREPFSIRLPTHGGLLAWEFERKAMR
jgi:hypothetical protein